MALTLDFRISAVASDASYVILTDYTVYGTPNQLRNTVAVAMKAYKVDEDQVESTQVVQAYDPETITAFQVTNTIDGWVRYYVVVVDNFNIATVYNRYDLVWDATGSAFYQYIFPTSSSGHTVSNTTYFSPVTDPTQYIRYVGLTNQVNNISYQVVNVVQRYLAESCYSLIATKVAKDACLDDCSPKNTLLNTFVRLDVLLNAAVIDEIDQLYVAGERAMRLAERYCDDCDCGCNSN